jgi:hypothetical protein
MIKQQKRNHNSQPTSWNTDKNKEKILESGANPRKGFPLNLRGIKKRFFVV